jgi:hypothetical protein
VSACPKKWSQWLSLAEFWYNTSYHTTIGRSPFEALYGAPPWFFGMTAASAPSVGDLSQWLQERQVVTELIKQHLHCVVIRMKNQADKGRSEREFSVRDLVFLKLQPYVQSSLTPRSNQKLSFKCVGPFPVLKRIHSVAYKLDLSAYSTIHPVFHVPQLKKAVGAQVLVSSSLPLALSELQVSKKILQRRMVTHGLLTVAQVLIQWSTSPASLAT